jgi:hypothetical protein
MDFNNISYLKDGNDRQKSAYKMLTEHSVFEKLQSFSPLLTGTIPINIDVHDSDLDIICCFKSKNNFIETLIEAFSKYDSFTLAERNINNRETVLANFYLGGFEIEIFAQNRPTHKQEAFRHMIIEYEILLAHDENFRVGIIKLKKEGMKTEPAFAHMLGLAGDPYKELLKYKQS